jgi:hypothetical protein
MTKKLLSVLLVTAIFSTVFFSCKKSNNSTVDATLNYFPLTLGKSVTYAVDSIYYFGSSCTQYEVKSYMKYSITDTFTDNLGRVSYIMDIFSATFSEGFFKQTGVILITPAPTPLATTSSTPTTSLLYTQDGTQYVKLIFPIVPGFTWTGNQYANIQDTPYSYLANWNYSYQNYNLSYNTDYINFEHTVTVIEDNESVNTQPYDSLTSGYLTYAKEVYAYNVGMVYKEWTHYTYSPSNPGCKNGYTVVMQAVNYQ